MYQKRTVAALPKTLAPFADKIADVDDERGTQNGWWVYLKRGWKSDTDPLGCLHQIHEDTLAQCARGLKYALPCDCEDCQTGAK